MRVRKYFLFWTTCGSITANWSRVWVAEHSAQIELFLYLPSYSPQLEPRGKAFNVDFSSGVCACAEPKPNCVLLRVSTWLRLSSNLPERMASTFVGPAGLLLPFDTSQGWSNSSASSQIDRLFRVVDTGCPRSSRVFGWPYPAECNSQSCTPAVTDSARSCWASS
jgi:hypothetical protein